MPKENFAAFCHRSTTTTTTTTIAAPIYPSDSPIPSAPLPSVCTLYLTRVVVVMEAANRCHWCLQNFLKNLFAAQ